MAPTTGKFRIGERVRVVSVPTRDWNWQLGKMGNVTSINDDPEHGWIFVRLDLVDTDYPFMEKDLWTLEAKS